MAGTPLYGVITAGIIWGLYNAALSMIFGFAPAMLTERGWSLSASSFTTSIVLWLAAISVPLGGLIADKTGRRDAVLLIGLLSFAILMAIAPNTDQIIVTFAALGLAGGLAAGPIMSLPSEVLQSGNRAQGMGVFFTLFYLGVVVAPVIAGWLSELLGSAGFAFLLGSLMLVLSCFALMIFRNLETRFKSETTHHQ